MLQMLIAAPNSGSGKTTVTIALLAALKARGLNPCAFKSGPDYIDPMFHRSVLGVESHNLDLFFSKPQIVQNLYNKSAANHGAAICEGAMGYYDGLGGTSDKCVAFSRYVESTRSACPASEGCKLNPCSAGTRLNVLPHTAPYRRCYTE